MMYSQNGWSANNAALMAAFTIPSSKVRVTLRKGDASVVLLYLLEQFNQTVEPLRQADTGGYNPRLVRGSASVISNHASGTATDTNWNEHVRGRRGTFKTSQVAAIRKILGFLEGTVRWGGDYKKASIDEMHFEVNASPSKLAKVADKIRAWRVGKTLAAVVGKATAAVAGKPPAWPKGTPAFRASTDPKYSPTVLAWQTRMAQRRWSITRDGRYGPKSADVAEAFQREKHLHIDRLLGPQTFAAAWTAKETK